MPTQDHDDPEKGWSEYRRLVLSQLDALTTGIGIINRRMDDLHSDDLSKIKVDIAMLKVQAGIIGAICGAVPGIVIAVVSMLMKK